MCALFTNHTHIRVAVQVSQSLLSHQGGTLHVAHHLKINIQKYWTEVAWPIALWLGVSITHEHYKLISASHHPFHLRVFLTCHSPQHKHDSSGSPSGGVTLKESLFIVSNSFRDRLESLSCLAISANISSTPAPVLQEVLKIPDIRLWHCSL